MKKAIRVLGVGAVVPIIAALVIAPGCGSGDFLGLEDYQRDLLMTRNDDDVFRTLFRLFVRRSGPIFGVVRSKRSSRFLV